jgi:hypothetical protein
VILAFKSTSSDNKRKKIILESLSFVSRSHLLKRDLFELMGIFERRNRAIDAFRRMYVAVSVCEGRDQTPSVVWMGS